MQLNEIKKLNIKVRSIVNPIVDDIIYHHHIWKQTAPTLFLHEVKKVKWFCQKQNGLINGEMVKSKPNGAQSPVATNICFQVTEEKELNYSRSPGWAFSCSSSDP